MAKNLKFRKLKASDWKDMFKYGSSYEVTEFLNWGPFKDFVEAKQAITLLKSRKGIVFAIDVFGEMVGTGTMFVTDEYKKLIEVEVVLNKTHWGMGIGYSTMMKIIKYATAWYKDYTLFSVINKKHEAGIALMKKSGFNKKEINNRIRFEMKIY